MSDRRAFIKETEMNSPAIRVPFLEGVFADMLMDYLRMIIAVSKTKLMAFGKRIREDQVGLFQESFIGSN